MFQYVIHSLNFIYNEGIVSSLFLHRCICLQMMMVSKKSYVAAILGFVSLSMNFSQNQSAHILLFLQNKISINSNFSLVCCNLSFIFI